MTVDEVAADHRAQDVTIAEPAILIKIKALYRRGMSAQALYDSTRKSWVLAVPNARDDGCAASSGIIRQAYRINELYPSEDAPERWAFRGEAQMTCTITLEAALRSSSRRAHLTRSMF